MKNILTLVAIIFAVTLVFAQDETSTNPPPGFATRADYLKSLTSEKKMLEAYHAGLISKDEAGQLLENFGDKSSMDTYGKVVDQDGNPVAGVLVRAGLETEFGDPKEYDIKTDDQGRFHLLGLRGTGLDICPEKAGYDFDYKLPCSTRPGLYVPDPSNPLIITMYKPHGGEPMVHDKLHAYIPCDGTATRFDLLTGKTNPDGNLSVSLIRNPLNIDFRKPFDWTLTLQITNGGFQAITNMYPNEAPADGYQSSLIFHYESGSSNWTSKINPQLYFKGKNGQVYGRMTLNVMADFQPPPTLFDAEIYANPNGSRNLEFDPNKEIIR